MERLAADSRQCALCGYEDRKDHFLATERWTRQEVEASDIRREYLQRAEVDGEGNHIFYFCRWRHLGDFLSEASLGGVKQSNGRDQA